MQRINQSFLWVYGVNMGNLKYYFVVLGCIGWTLALVLGCGKEKPAPKKADATVYGTWKELTTLEMAGPIRSDSIVRIEDGKVTFTKVCYHPNLDRPMRANAISPASIDEAAKRMKIAEKAQSADPLAGDKKCQVENDPGEYAYRFGDDGQLQLINRETGQIRYFALVSA